MKMDTATWGLVISLAGAVLVYLSEVVDSMIPLFAGLFVGWLGISTILRARREENED